MRSDVCGEGSVGYKAAHGEGMYGTLQTFCDPHDCFLKMVIYTHDFERQIRLNFKAWVSVSFIP